MYLMLSVELRVMVGSLSVEKRGLNKFAGDRRNLDPIGDESINSQATSTHGNLLASHSHSSTYQELYDSR